MLNNMIEPFAWSCMEDGDVSVDLDAGTYRKDFFQKYAEEFEDECGSGYDWELFAERYLKKCFPDMSRHFQFDSEAELFCVYSGQKELLGKFVQELKSVTDDLGRMETVWKEVRKPYHVYAALEDTPSNEAVFTYVGVTSLSLKDRLRQHRINGRNFVRLFLIDSFMDLDEAKGYEEVIEEIMTNPTLNNKHLFVNENNSLHPNGDKELYENATEWAIVNMRNKDYMSPEGRLVIFDTFYREAENSGLPGLADTGVSEPDQIKDIAPFHIIELENGMLSVCLDTSQYKKEVFAKRDSEGIMGSGYDWERVARILWQESDLPDDVYFDSEADLFCAYSGNSGLIMELASQLKKACETDSELDAVVDKI